MADAESFVILAGMRTGSNFLEASLNELGGVTCHGELFNPAFIGHHNRHSLLGFDMAARERAPLALLERVKEETEGLAGLRFFHDHDPRILDHLLDDTRCAKVLLSRNPLESFVSLRIARETGQWRLANVRNRRESGRVWFDEAAFADHLEAAESFRRLVKRRLRCSGQSWFEIDYDELGDVAILNGLASFLGVTGRLERPSRRVKRQNPEPVTDRVANPEEMRAALARLDPFALSHQPRLEPSRAPGVRRFVAAPEAPVLHMALPGAPDARVEAWLAALDGAGPDALHREFTQSTLADWRRANPGARSFAVVSHPLARAHRVFWQRILHTGEGGFHGIRRALSERHGLPVPADGPGPDYDAARHHGAFLSFLRFLMGNLAGQTGIRIDPHWSSQGVLLEGIAAVGPPDFLIREERMAAELPALAGAVGRPCPDPPHEDAPPIPLTAIHDNALETAARAVWPGDYARLGYGAWSPPPVTTPPAP